MEYRYQWLCFCVLALAYGCASASAYTELTPAEQASVMGLADGYYSTWWQGEYCPNCQPEDCHEWDDVTCVSDSCAPKIGCAQPGDADNCETKSENVCRSVYMVAKEPEDPCPTGATCGGTPQRMNPAIVRVCAYDDGQKEETCPDW
ncbi:MAG TPA: hypothetical protein DGT21_03795 [Armatimonadetes bacterium]|nr:hypothetical protein [Armatimonadota bacterium]